MSYLPKQPKFDAVTYKDQGIAVVPPPAAGNYKLLNRVGSFLVQNPASVETPIAGFGAQSGNIRASEGAGTTTLTNGDNRIQVFNLTADRIVVLPTAGVGAGNVWTMVNDNPWKLIIQASDASVIILNWGDSVELAAEINTPVTNSDWTVTKRTIIYGRSFQSWVPTISAGSVTSSVIAKWCRASIDVMHVHGYLIFSSASGTNTLSVSFPAPNGTPLTFNNFLQGEGDILGQCALFFNTHVFLGFTTVTGTGTATDITFFTGYTAVSDATAGGNSVQTVLQEGYPNINGSILTFDAFIPITEWKEI